MGLTDMNTLTAYHSATDSVSARLRWTRAQPRHKGPLLPIPAKNEPKST